MTPDKKSEPVAPAAKNPAPKNLAAAANLPALPPLGAHMSVAGGVDKALERAAAVDATALQIFLKNNNQWKGKPLDDAVVERFRAGVAASALLAPPIAHASYLINLGGAQGDLVEKSMENLLDDLRRAEALGVAGIVFHPGAHMGEGEAVAIARIGERVRVLLDQTAGSPVALYIEGTAGQGSSVGHRFEHLRDIIAGAGEPARLGVCLDTCHLLAAGYDLRTPEAVAATLTEFERVVGLARLRAVHVNDSKKDLGSRVDRHEHIGQGKIGEAGFAAWLADPRLRLLPHVLETPKGDDLAEDRVNLAVLRRLAGAA